MIFVDKKTTSGASATDSRRELLSRIVASSLFAKAERLSTLLLYICDVALNSRADELSEQNIGEAVFGRSRDYDSANDGIVRAQVSRLRQRLDLYFEGEGVNEPVRVVIPRGGYIPFFKPRPPKELVISASPMPIADAMDLHVEPLRIAKCRSSRTAVAWGLVAVLAVVVLVLSLKNVGAFRKGQPNPVTAHPLWSQMFAPDQQTTLVLADSNLVVWQGMMKRDVPLAEYLNGSYRTTVPTTASPIQKEAVQIAQGRYTSMIDVEMI